MKAKVVKAAKSAKKAEKGIDLKKSMKSIDLKKSMKAKQAPKISLIVDARVKENEGKFVFSKKLKKPAQHALTICQAIKSDVITLDHLIAFFKDNGIKIEATDMLTKNPIGRKVRNMFYGLYASLILTGLTEKGISKFATADKKYIVPYGPESASKRIRINLSNDSGYKKVAKITKETPTSEAVKEAVSYSISEAA